MKTRLKFGTLLFCILFFNSFFLQAQDVYESLWAEADSLDEEGLPQSALEKINEIYQRAQEEQNAPQFIKAIEYQLKLRAFVEEDALAGNINYLKEQAENAFFPAKPMLHSMLAEVYWQYYEDNYWQYYDRTETINFDPADIQTWDLRRITEATLKQYQLSLQKPEELQQVAIDDFSEIIYEGTADYRAYRSTLYDFLGHRAIDFLMYNETDLVQPRYQFTLNNPEYLSNYDNFAQLDLTSPDSLSYKFYALTLLQDLIRFHQNDADYSALIDLDLKRLSMVHSQMTLSNKDRLYLETLQNLESQNSGLAIAAQITYQIARLYYQQGQKYQPLNPDDENKWKKKEAFDLCQTAIERFPDSYGAANCKSLQSTIQTKSLSLMAESVNVPNQPFRIKVEYTNVKELHFRIIPITRKQYQKLQDKYYYDELYEEFTKLKPVETWSVSLPDDGDFQWHGIEAVAPALPADNYLILVSANAEFSLEENTLRYATTTNSNIAYIHRSNDEEGTTEFYMLHRETGEPLANVQAQVWMNYYDYDKSKYISKKGELLISDSEGYILIPYDAEHEDRDYYVEFTFGKEQFYSNGFTGYYANLSSYKYENETYIYPYTYFFTDRMIYRPGQTIYFKGIYLQQSSDGKKPEILANTNTTVVFYDANWQEVETLELTTNEFGSFSGSFTAPRTGLMGQMYIENIDGSGSVYFSVEEYKRPKFEVSYEPVEGTYRLNEEIKVTGKATAFSGANIDGAEVSYRVVREANFPYWYYYYYSFYPSSPSMEIISGTTQTDENGNFEVIFTAIPDLDVSPESEPTFRYRIEADVTDLNGETRSNSTTVSVGYKSLLVNVEVPAQLNQNEERKLKINSTNLDGNFETAQGTISVYRLQNPDRTYRNRWWAEPDKHLYSKEEWEAMFPHDLYQDESNIYKWEKEDLVFETSFDTEQSRELMLENLTSWKTGQYYLEINSTDKFGEEVKGVSYFVLYNPDDKQVNSGQTDVYIPVKMRGEPNETAQLLVGTADESIHALFEVEHQGEIIRSEWLDLNKQQQLLEIPIQEAHRGNIALSYAFIRHNQLYLHSDVVQVPYTNKQLDISFETFRDKLQPGEEETWRIKIAGKNADKVAAEMVATLYDASLDEFRPNNWSFDLYNSYYATRSWRSDYAFNYDYFSNYDGEDWNTYEYGSSISYDYLNWFGYSYYSYYDYYGYDDPSFVTEGSYALEESEEVYYMADEAVMDRTTVANKPAPKMKKEAERMYDYDKMGLESSANGMGDGLQGIITGGEKDLTQIKARKNFNETAFFEPHLQTNAEGEIIVEFTIPEALTKWKMMGFAHTQDLSYGMAFNELITQKELMVVPNAPRFLRENDKIIYTSKITNISEKDLTGSAQLFLFDATTNEPIDLALGNDNAQQTFTAKAGQSTQLRWELQIPEGISAVTHKVVAQADNFSDGEEMSIPVLTNSMLVTETLPLPIRSNETKTFELAKLTALAGNPSATLRHQKYTLEFTSNPAWYAIQALPYLMEFPHECAEQTFNRVYANTIAAHIANSSPKIKEVFDTWKELTPDALASNLEKNQELKAVFLEETPWVLQAQSETERKHRVGVLFDLNRMAEEMERALQKLQDKQVSNGAWAWFEGMPEDRYITQYIATGIGHLDKLGIDLQPEMREMAIRAFNYLDKKIKDDYDELKRMANKKQIKLKDKHIGYYQIQYLYARSFFLDEKLDNKYQEAFDYFLGQAEKYWLSENKYMQGMIALASHRYGNEKIPAKIVKSLREHSLNSEEMGMYWKDDYGYFWYQAPIERQALMIEVFAEVAQDQQAVDDLKTWLLKQKQTQDWETTTATSDACYALLLQGTNWLAGDELVEISIAGETINPYSEDNSIPVEAGTGYFKTSWEGNEITPEMGNITVSKSDEGAAWGAVYWQYFEQLDKITSSETPLSLKKQLFLEQNSDTGPVITPIEEGTSLKVGDKVKVRIELRVDRVMEYVHMKDMRASAFEPTNVISRYKYQDGLGYYESTKDAATHFFFGYLPKGTYVFEYPMRVTHEGDFSNGITTIQCMYAPEFSSHSEGVRVLVGE